TGNHTHTVGGHYVGDSIGGKPRVQVYGTEQVSSVAGDHSHTISGSTNTTGNHQHTVAIGAHTHTVAIGAHTHKGTVTLQSSEHTHSGTTGTTGAGQAFSVEQPSFVVYVWQRTA
ncbi:phage tail protein, partial [Salmonella enterica subsp. enterica serovar Typhimurium]|nr:phage tail protein [Salmonella enterica subsp. enterica serovar Typhimurium]